MSKVLDISQHRSDTTRAELQTLYDLYRTADLNVRYYGLKANRLMSRYRWLQALSALSSAAAVAGAVQNVPVFGKSIWVAFATVAAVTTAVASVYDLPNRISRLEHLHVAYVELFHQLELLLHEIRRNVYMTDENLGMSRVLQQLYTRMGPKDETAPDRKLLSILQSEVNRALPPERMWMPEQELRTT